MYARTYTAIIVHMLGAKLRAKGEYKFTCMCNIHRLGEQERRGGGRRRGRGRGRGGGRRRGEGEGRLDSQ